MRAQGWEVRLDAVLESARSRSYEIGAHDCFSVACCAVEALTGAPSRWPEWEGKYHSEREAIDLILERGGFVRAASDWFGSEPIGVRNARRGDICAYRDARHMRHLGVCVGEHAAVLGPSGLVFVPLAECLCAWRIG